ncbi:MAG TPA: large conductance mechanosensitive channel protein MscL [Terrimesophilobacter sp.]|nr:large conductance mechanosensitive channel protein MscL [Terrimesophilobacter sp.]HRP99836.1 large conductance mechanosensitive channel protein MscL [Terrimesophilobacter sp.]
MFAGFKEFIMRGNVIDLAVAVVIGAAFTAVVNALVEGLLNPALGALFNADNLKDAWTVSILSVSGGEPATLMFGAVVAAAIQFLLVAAAVYFVLVMPMNKMRERAEARRAAGAPPEEVAPDELSLLTEIRDLLAARKE